MLHLIRKVHFMIYHIAKANIRILWVIELLKIRNDFKIKITREI